MIKQNLCSIVLLFQLLSPLLAYEKMAHLSGWYPSNKSALNKKLIFLDTQAQKQYQAHVKPSTIQALIAPHAGLRYSGSIAASVYRLTDPNTKRIIILAPDHKTGSKNISIPSFTTYNLPNKTLALDTDIIRSLSLNEKFSYNDNVFNTEHSLEMQLPFIAHYLPTAHIVPLIVGRINCDQAHDIAHVLKKYITHDTLVIITSDFTHYGTRFKFTPFKDHQDLRVRQLDSQAIELIEKGNCSTFETFMREKKPTICGSNPLKVLLALIKNNMLGTIQPRLVGYDTSANAQDRDSVSYVGMIFTTEKLQELPIKQQLTQQEQQSLLLQARNTLDHMFEEDFDETLYYPIKSFGVRQSLGAFATINTNKDKLRGCIGNITTKRPLYKTIARVTKSAALHDSRFKPITKEEANDLSLSLSILSQPKEIKSYKNIILGTHGIILSRGLHRSVFLPKVPTKFGWTREHTLSRLSKKARLSAHSWKEGDIKFEIFESLDIK